MSGDRKVIILLLFSILLLGGLSFYVLDALGVINAGEYISYFAPKNPEKLEDSEYPSEVDKLSFQKREDTLFEKEEQLLQKETELTQKENDISVRMAEIETLMENVRKKEEDLTIKVNDVKDRSVKITDLAVKVTSMEPQKAKAMMENWPDYEIIEVMREIDRQATAEGTPSLVPYLLSLFTPERSADITRKMLLPQIEPSLARE